MRRWNGRAAERQSGSEQRPLPARHFGRRRGQPELLGHAATATHYYAVDVPTVRVSARAQTVRRRARGGWRRGSVVIGGRGALTRLDGRPLIFDPVARARLVCSDRAARKRVDVSLQHCGLLGIVAVRQRVGEVRDDTCHQWCIIAAPDREGLPFEAVLAAHRAHVVVLRRVGRLPRRSSSRNRAKAAIQLQMRPVSLGLASAGLGLC